VPQLHNPSDDIAHHQTLEQRHERNGALAAQIPFARVGKPFLQQLPFVAGETRINWRNIVAAARLCHQRRGSSEDEMHANEPNL